MRCIKILPISFFSFLGGIRNQKRVVYRIVKRNDFQPFKLGPITDYVKIDIQLTLSGLAQERHFELKFNWQIRTCSIRIYYITWIIHLYLLRVSKEPKKVSLRQKRIKKYHFFHWILKTSQMLELNDSIDCIISAEFIVN